MSPFAVKTSDWGTLIYHNGQCIDMSRGNMQQLPDELDDWIVPSGVIWFRVLLHVQWLVVGHFVQLRAIYLHLITIICTLFRITFEYLLSWCYRSLDITFMHTVCNRYSTKNPSIELRMRCAFDHANTINVYRISDLSMGLENAPYAHVA